MKCKLCQEFYKKYPLQEDKDEYSTNTLYVHQMDGYAMSEVKCAFKSGEFSENNWNCSTLDLIRDLCYEGQDLHHYITYQYCEDQKYATINISYCEEVPGHALWISWYKTRGKTDSIWILDSYNKPRRPTEEDCIKIYKYFVKLIKEENKKLKPLH